MKECDRLTAGGNGHWLIDSTYLSAAPGWNLQPAATVTPARRHSIRLAVRRAVRLRASRFPGYPSSGRSGRADRESEQ